MLCRHECNFRARSLTSIPIQTHNMHFNRCQSKFTKEFLPSYFSITFALSLCIHQFDCILAISKTVILPTQVTEKMRKCKIYLPKSATLWFRLFFTNILCRTFRSSEMNLLWDLWRGHDKTFVVITDASNAFNEKKYFYALYAFFCFALQNPLITVSYRINIAS